MNMSWGAGNDYSMILHAVEDNITDVINISDSDDNSDDNNNNNNNNDSHNNHDESSSDGDEGGESIMSTAGNMQMELQLDDVKLKNEELRDKLRTMKDDFNREKDKYLRQLQFLESENISIKKELSVRTEKYYDTKKKLQTVVRSCDSEKKKLLAQISQLTSQSSTSSATLSDNTHRLENKKLEQSAFDEKMTTLEKKILEKSTQVKNISIQNAKLQEECTTLQQQLLLARSEGGDKDELGNLRQLQSQVQELEFTLRQKNREYDKLKKSAKNSHILEENLSTCNAKVLSLQESIKNYQLMEVEYSSLVEEKQSWTVHFQELIRQSDGDDPDTKETTSMKEAAIVTPISILRLLSNIQNKCASLLRDKGLLENQISDLTNEQRRSALQAQQVDLELTEKANKVMQLENSNTLLRQQAKLYEGEVMSLRSLLKTFDAEILIFGNKKKRSRTSLKTDKNTNAVDDEEKCGSSSSSEVGVLLNLKNQEIENLQRELDQQRASSATVLKKLMSDVEGLSQARHASKEISSSDGESQTVIADLRRDVHVYKEQCAALKDDMYWFQKSAGFDFIPQKTKVLHAKHNPSLARFQTQQTAGDQMEMQMDVINTCSSSSSSSTSGGGDGDDEDEDVATNDASSTSAYFITPLDELRHLKNLVRTGKLVPPSSVSASVSASASATHPFTSASMRSSSSSEAGADNRSRSGSTGNSGLDTSLSMNASRGNVSMSAGGGVDSQKMNQRLKEVFREKIAEYREAVYLLFGYKVDLMPADSITGEPGSSMLKLRSMYAESPDDALKFVQWKGREGLEILETPFAAGLDDSIMQALRSSNSVPVFMSEITLDLFSKQTFMG